MWDGWLWDGWLDDGGWLWDGKKYNDSHLSHNLPCHHISEPVKVALKQPSPPKQHMRGVPIRW